MAAPLTACVTMMKDEAFFLPIWHRYYASQFGEKNLYILDHSSSNSVRELLLPEVQSEQLNVIRVPSPEECGTKPGSAAFDVKRFKLISSFIEGLLNYYDTVLFNDTDEIFFPNPNWYGSLREYAKKNFSRAPVQAGLGIEIIHDSKSEPDFDHSVPIFSQRKYFRWNFLYSKPHILSKPAELLPHTSSKPFLLDPDLYLVHMKYIDRNHLYDRQESRSNLAEDLGMDNFRTWLRTGDELETELDQLNRLPIQENPRTGRRALRRHFNVDGPVMIGADPGLTNRVRSGRDGHCLIDYLDGDAAWLSTRRRHVFSSNFAETGY